MGLLNTLSFIADHPLTRSDKLGALTRFARWQIGSRLMPGAIVVDFIDDTKLVVTPGMTGATGNIYCGLHEYEDMAFALHVLRPGDLFVDVGANVGSYTVLAGAAGADVLAFEPGERFTDLQRNVAINGMNAELRNQAVGAEAGTLRFTVGLDSINRAALDDEPFVEVPVVPLDEAVGERVPVLIKVDVEGYEGAVLAGGARPFGAATAVIMELNGQTLRYGHDEDDVRAAMSELGYVLTGYDPVKRCLKPPTARGNSIFVRGDVEERLRNSRQFRVLGQLV